MAKVDNRQVIENVSLTFLHECFILDREAGDLIWKVRPESHFSRKCVAVAANKAMAGKRAGSVCAGRGRRNVHLMGKYYLVHRIIFAMANGIELSEVPIIVDHINGDQTNNRSSNMRGADYLQSAWNRGLQVNTPHGFVGVSLERSGRWSASIRAMGKYFHLGTFDTKEEAGAAYIGAAKVIRGEFFRETTQAAA